MLCFLPHIIDINLKIWLAKLVKVVFENLKLIHRFEIYFCQLWIIHNLLICGIGNFSEITLILLISLRKVTSKDFWINLCAIVVWKPRVSNIQDIDWWTKIFINRKNKTLRLFIIKMRLFIRLINWLWVDKATVHNWLIKSKFLRLSIKISELKVCSSNFFKIFKCLNIMITFCLKRIIRIKEKTQVYD